MQPFTDVHQRVVNVEERMVWQAVVGTVEYRGDGPIELANPEAVVARARAILGARPLIFLCGCRDHRICHRAVAADYMTAAFGCHVLHLYPHPKPGHKPAAMQQSLF